VHVEKKVVNKEGKERRKRGKGEKRTIVLHLDVVSLVFRREEYSVVFKSLPLYTPSTRISALFS